jgi:hypothetical protein
MPKIWTAKLEGHTFDIEDWREMFVAPFEPWVEVVMSVCAEIYVLRSSIFDAAANGEETRARAIPLIEKMNGAALLFRNCEPVSFGGAVSIENGQVSIHRSAEMHATGRARLKGMAAIMSISGTVIPAKTSVASDVQDWITRSDENDLVADLLTHVSRATNWYDLYKVMELAEQINGGEHEFSKRLGSMHSDWKSVRTTSNYYRHACGHRPSKLVQLPEAKSIVMRIVRDMLQDL